MVNSLRESDAKSCCRCESEIAGLPKNVGQLVQLTEEAYQKKKEDGHGMYCPNCDQMTCTSCLPTLKSKHPKNLFGSLFGSFLGKSGPKNEIDVEETSLTDADRKNLEEVLKKKGVKIIAMRCPECKAFLGNFSDEKKTYIESFSKRLEENDQDVTVEELNVFIEDVQKLKSRFERYTIFNEQTKKLHSILEAVVKTFGLPKLKQLISQYIKNREFDEAEPLCAIGTQWDGYLKNKSSWEDDLKQIKNLMEITKLVGNQKKIIEGGRPQVIRVKAVNANEMQAKAINKQGEAYLAGNGVDQDYVKAYECFQKAAEMDYPLAQFSLGSMYENGWGVTQSYTEAAKWYQKAADKGNADAQCNLGVMCKTGQGVTRSHAEAAKWFKKAADQGHANAQSNLGAMCLNGESVPKSESEAVKWFQKASEQGNTGAQYNLGIMHLKGVGASKNESEAVKWFQKAADQGHADSQFNLGVMYSGGMGVPKNDSEAVKWYQKAAEQGHSDAQCNLGGKYLNGDGVPKSMVEAVNWFRKAAEQGEANPQYYLGLMHANGEGVPKNEAEGVKWLQKAADQGHADAQYNLGIMHINGMGVPKNEAEAVKWYEKAADQGHEGAIEELAKTTQSDEEDIHLSEKNDEYYSNAAEPKSFFEKVGDPAFHICWKCKTEINPSKVTSFKVYDAIQDNKEGIFYICSSCHDDFREWAKDKMPEGSEIFFVKNSTEALVYHRPVGSIWIPDV